VIPLERPFSNFAFVDSRYAPGHFALRRIFSQARAAGCKALVVEDIEATGAVAEEQQALAALDASYDCPVLQRLTFWTSSSSDGTALPELSSRFLTGYAVVKRDVLPGRGIDLLHVFESVFRKHPHVHNCVPGCRQYRLRCLGDSFAVRGVMYCQQNALNKACAHVAIRSLLTLFRTDQDFPYRPMNDVASVLATLPFDPGRGLNSDQISAVLRHHGLALREINYELPDVAATDFPYDKWLYSAIESGRAGLIGFEFSGPAASGERHVVPFFGHTFNQDTWAPKALGAYFHVGDDLKFISSLEWMSSFIGHDDNFGANYCVPRHFIRPENVKYVAAVMPEHCAYDATIAEATALRYLYSSLPTVLGAAVNLWVDRVVEHISQQDIVLRAVAITRRQYVTALARARDWDDHSEDAALVAAFRQFLPRHLWLVEISIPDLFAANHHKVGEILLDSQVPAVAPPGSHHLVTIRLPESYLLPGPGFPGKAEFYRIPSNLANHSSVFRFRGRLW